MKTNVEKYLALRGHRVRDKVTAFEGIVTAISFDLYGCIQALVNPGLDKEQKPRNSEWLDLNRIDVLTVEPVMTVPTFDYGPIAEAQKGPAEKPVASGI